MKNFSVFISFLMFINNGFSTTLNIQRWQTTSGTLVYFAHAPHVPMVDIKFAFKAGSAYDDQNWGIAALTADLLDQGADNLSASDIAESFESNGTQYTSEVSRDMTTISLRSLSDRKTLEASINTFSKLLSQPIFAKTPVERQKSQQITMIKYESEVPQKVANNSFYASLYKQHPYAHAINGTLKTVATLNQEKIRKFYQNHYQAKEAVLAIVGSISKQQAHQIAETLSEKLPKGSKTTKLTNATPTNYKPVTIPFPSKQTVIRIGQLGIEYRNPNYFPLIVGNYTLGGSGLVSKLAEEIREKRGLSYGISSYFTPLAARGPFMVSLATKAPQAKQAIEITQKTLQNFVNAGPTKDELLAAKKYLNGSFPLRLSSNKAICNTILLMGFYNLPNDYLETYLKKVNAVDKEAITKAFHQQLNTNNMLLVTVGTNN